MMRLLLTFLLFLVASPAVAQNDPCRGSSPTAQTTTDLSSAMTTQGGNSVVVDASSLFKNGPDVGSMASVLQAIANEPGEKGYLGLNVTAGGKFGSGAVNGSVEGEVDLEVSYLVSDENRVVLGMDLAAAIKAGISLAGLFEVGGKFEGGGSVVKLSFPDAESAAAWLTQQLDSINARTKYKLWPKGSVNIPSGVSDPVALTDRWIAGGVYAQGGVGRFSASAEGKAKREYRQFNGIMDGQKVDITQITDHLIGSVNLNVDWRGAPVQVKYTYDQSTVSNSPFYYNNGKGVEHVIEIKVPIVHKEKTLGSTEGAPTDGAQDLLVNVFAAIEKYAPGTTLKGANYKAFEAIVEQAYKNASSTSKIGATTYLTFTLDMNYAVESDGSQNLMYQRLLIGGEQHLGTEFNIKAVKVGIDVSAGKTENVYERIGTDTVSYIQRQYVYETQDRPWSEFKQDNESALQELIKNISDPNNLHYNKDVANAYNNGGYEAGMKALENFWTNENNQISQIRQDAIDLANISNKWLWANRDDTLRKDMADIFWKYRSDEQMRQYLFDLVDDYGGQPDKIKTLSTGNDSYQTWRLWVMTKNFKVKK